MGIIQSIIWTCDICNRTKVSYQEIKLNEDLEMTHPDTVNWGYVSFDDDDKKPKLLCDYCLEKIIDYDDIPEFARLISP